MGDFEKQEGFLMVELTCEEEDCVHSKSCEFNVEGMMKGTYSPEDIKVDIDEGYCSEYKERKKKKK